MRIIGKDTCPLPDTASVCAPEETFVAIDPDVCERTHTRARHG